MKQGKHTNTDGSHSDCNNAAAVKLFGTGGRFPNNTIISSNSARSDNREQANRNKHKSAPVHYAVFLLTGPNSTVSRRVYRN